MPPMPTEKAFSRQTKRLALPIAASTALSGNGRNEVIPRTPIFSPRARRSSTTSLIVPSTDPSAMTTVSASSIS
jgi:hypothetical protein